MIFRSGTKVVFFGAHTDDEMVCAGTLARLRQTNNHVTIVAFGTAATKNDRKGTVASRDILALEFAQSLRCIGANGICYPTNDNPMLEESATLHTLGQEIADYVYEYCERESPDLAITLSPFDENPAHAEVGKQCERVMRGRVANLWRCIFPWNYVVERPNLYVSLTEDHMEVKRQVIRSYQSQKFRYNYEDMLVSQARADGLSVKVPYAEKFEVIRSVV